MSRLSIIEQAAKRLEELKRSGVDVPVPPVQTRSSLPAAPLGRSTAVGAGTGDARVAGRANDTTPNRGTQPAASPALLAGSTGYPGSDKRCSASVEIDLGRLARMGYLIPGQATTSLASEFRLIKRPLLRNVDRDSSSSSNRTSLIMITSAIAGEGKTFCSINLAMSIAMEVDTSVLLVDADVIRPSVLHRLGLPPAPGLLDLLSGSIPDVADVLLRTNIAKLSILPAGAPRNMSTELLASEAMDNLLTDLATRYPDRVIVLDAPPLLLATESPVLASRVGQVVLVIDSLNTSRHKVSQALTTVESCPIVLSLLNKCRTTTLGDGYGYSYQ
jgi:protein-tyrosine kinase